MNNMEGMGDMFMRMSDKRDIVDFVKEIEKYPCLYNRTIPDYANKVHNRKAWSTIAKKFNTTVPDCRDKWRKIRISFMRSLKQQMSDKPPMRPYYLSEELQFLQPFLKINQTKKTPDQKDELMDCENPALQTKNISDSESSNICESDLLEDEPENRVNDRSIENSTEKKCDVVYDKEISRNECSGEKSPRINYTDIIESNPRTNPRKMFLLSLLPEVELFSESEMRIFRRKVIDACDEIVNSHYCRNVPCPLRQ